MPKTLNSRLLVVFVSIVLLFAPRGIAFGAMSGEDYVFKVTIENHLEQRLYNALSGITGTENLIVLVSADVETDVRRQPDDRRKMLQQQQSDLETKSRPVLPGVPVKKEIGSEKKYDVQLPSMSDISTSSAIRKLVVNIIVDKKVPESYIGTIHDVAINAITYRPERGDKLNITQVSFQNKKYDWSVIVKPPYLYWTILVILGSFFLIATTFFILNPFQQLTSVLRNINWDALRGTKAVEEKKGGDEGALSLSALAAEKARADGDRVIPFSFIRERHIPEIAFLLKDSPAGDIAIVINYLTPELAIKLIEFYPESKQAEIALNLGINEEIKPDKVQGLEESLKMRVEYVVGGDSKLAAVLDFTEDRFRDRVFELLESKSSEMAARLRKKVKGFEAVMRSLPAQGIQILFRQLDPTTFAQVLKSSPGDIQTRVLESLSEGASERMQQEMELSRPLSGERLKKERFLVLSIVRQMIRAGLIEEEF